MKSRLELAATLVADEFIDRYMPLANGEYVKVYLYLLRHQERQVTVTEMADALDYTESDIRRALAYWMRLGVLADESEAAGPANRGVVVAAESSGHKGEAESLGIREGVTEAHGNREVSAASAIGGEASAASAIGGEAATASATGGEPVTASAMGGEAAASSATGGEAVTASSTGGNPATASDIRKRMAEPTKLPAQRETYTPEQVKKLSEEEEFTQLLYIAQKYLNKVFTPRECEVFAYLYDGLHMSSELLEYLVEYCVQGSHTSIRYLETVGLNWHENGIDTVEKAKRHTACYSNEAFAVMRAFGIGDRRPGSSEMEMIQRWFHEWGFKKELVMEACGRTLGATNKPSFAYTDRILLEWKKSNVHSMEDVRKLDEQYEAAKADQVASRMDGQQRFGQAADQAAGRAAGQQSPRQASGQTSGEAARKGARPGNRTAVGARNRFHNFEQRDTNYDAMALRQLRERLGEP